MEEGAEVSLFAKLPGRRRAETVCWLEADELAGLLDRGSAPLVIDVCGCDEFAGPLGHIESARNIPLDLIPAQSSDLLGTKRRLVFVCHTDRRSAAAAEYLRHAGGTEIAILRGGMVAWRSRPAS